MSRRKDSDKVSREVALKYASGDYTQQELAEKYDVSQSTISRYVKFGSMSVLAKCGIRTTDSSAVINKKAAAAGITNPIVLGGILSQANVS